MYGSIAKREKKSQIYTASCSSSGNTELIEHELLKINFSKSHQYCYRQTPTSVKKLLAFQSPIFHDLSPSGWESLCLQWCLPCCSKAASCLNVCKWNYVLKLTLPFLGGGLLFGCEWPLTSPDTAGRKPCKFACSSTHSLLIREYTDLPKLYSYLKPGYHYTFAVQIGLQCGKLTLLEVNLSFSSTLPWK